jgi:hypothetical protein
MDWKYSDVYDAQACAERVFLLQCLCVQSKTDGILVVNGVDGGSVPLSAAVMSWLLFGTCQLSTIQVRSQDAVHLNNFLRPPVPASSYDLFPSPDLLEDCMMCITPTSVRLYVPHTGLAMHMLQVPSLVVFSPPDKMLLEGDVDGVELFKIQSFVEMTRAVKTVGVVLPDQASSVMEVERWPIVQAYALESSQEARGFFSLQRHLVNMHDAIAPVVSSGVDAQFLAVVRTFIVPQLQRHVFDTISSCGRGNDIQSENPLSVYFSYGLRPSTAEKSLYRPSCEPCASFVTSRILHIRIVDPRWPVVCDRLVFASTKHDPTCLLLSAERSKYRRLIRIVRGLDPMSSDVKVDRVSLANSVELIRASEGPLVFSEVLGITNAIPAMLSFFDRLSTGHEVDYSAPVVDTSTVRECLGLTVSLRLFDTCDGMREMDCTVTYLSTHIICLSNPVWGFFKLRFGQDVVGTSLTVDNAWMVFNLSADCLPLFGAFSASHFAIRNDHLILRKHIPVTDASLAGLPDDLRAKNEQQRLDGNDELINGGEEPVPSTVDLRGVIVITGPFHSPKRQFYAALLKAGWPGASLFLADDLDGPVQAIRKARSAQQLSISLVVACLPRMDSLRQALAEYGAMDFFLPGFVQGIYSEHPKDWWRLVNKNLRQMTVSQAMHFARANVFSSVGNSADRSLWEARWASCGLQPEHVARTYCSVVSFSMLREEIVSDFVAKVRSAPHVRDVDTVAEDGLVTLRVLYGAAPNGGEQLVQALKDLIAKPRAEVKKWPSSVAEISAHERDQVRHEHLFDPLPEGYFFNGSEYVSFDGYHSRYHPDMEKFLQEYVMQHSHIESL